MSHYTPENSLEKHEEHISKNLPEIIKSYIQIATNTYNLTVYALSSFDNQLLTTMNDRLRISLVILARIANDIHCACITSEYGYGTQTCSIAANVWELAWQLVWVTRTDAAATEWLNAPYFTSGGPDPAKCLSKYLRTKNIPNIEEQIKLERVVYAKLCAMKHGNPQSFRFHSPKDWETHGTVRLGPDISEYGEKAACFGLYAASQLGELALQEFAQNHLGDAQITPFVERLREVTNLRAKLLEATNAVWSTFP